MSNGSLEKGTYCPAEIYRPLTEIGAKPEALIDILLRQCAPSLSAGVLNKRNEVADEVLVILHCLREKFVKALQEFGLWEGLQSRLPSYRRDGVSIPAVEEACRAISERNIMQDVRVALGNIRDALTPEILEVFGLVDRKSFNDTRAREPGAGTAEEQSGSYKFLSETFPDWVRPEWIQHPERFIDAVPTLTSDQLLVFPMLYKRALWIKRTHGVFQHCVFKAYSLLSKLRTEMIPEGGLTQPYGLTDDLGTKSIVELLEIILEPSSPEKRLRRRFDALQILEWAISFFDSFNHPIYRAQVEARKAIHELLNIGVWDEDMGLSPYPVTASGEGFAPNYPGKPSDNAGNEYFVLTRETNRAVHDILDQYEDILDPTADPCFQSRGKELESYVIKKKIIQEMVRKCEALLAGRSVEGFEDKKYAQKELNKLKKLVKQFHPDEIFPVKPASMNTINDSVGLIFTFAINKPLQDIEGDQVTRKRVNEFFREFSKFLSKAIGLNKSVRLENNLWKGKSENQRRSDKYRDFKIRGTRTVVLEDGESVNVPVEIQLLPLETHLHAKNPHSPVSHTEYARRRSRDLAVRVLPRRIGGVPMFADAVSGDVIDTVETI